MSDLLPCPFCGNQPQTLNTESGEIARCFDCRVSWRHDEQWNTRADTAELAALRAERDAALAGERGLCAQIVGYMKILGMADGDSEDVGEVIAALRDRAERAESDAAESKRRCGELETQRDIKHHALEAASGHLEYCGYGDKWEREGTDGLRQQIADGLAIGAPTPPEKPAPTGISDKERETRRRQSETQKALNAKLKAAALTPEASK